MPLHMRADGRHRQRYVSTCIMGMESGSAGGPSVISDHGHDVIDVRVANPGRDRETSTGYVLPRYKARFDAGDEALRWLRSLEDPWPELARWESDHHVRASIRQLCSYRYLVVPDPSSPETRDLWVPTRMLYPTALRCEDGRINDAAALVVLAVRQAREYDKAAKQVSETARPTLYYYAALMLARAVAIAVLGPDEFKASAQHGLNVPSGTEEPFQIKWQAKGAFPALYRAVRWDVCYGERPRVSPPVAAQFHIVECLRRLGYAVGHDALAWADGTGAIGVQRLLMADDPQTVAGRAPFFDADHLPNAGTLWFFDVPDIVVEFMVLYYYSILARYHPLAWRNVLAGTDEHGYLFRRSSNEVYIRYVQHVEEQLTGPAPGPYVRPQEWIDVKPDAASLQTKLPIILGQPRSPIQYYPPPGEWHG